MADPTPAPTRCPCGLPMINANWCSGGHHQAQFHAPTPAPQEPVGDVAQYKYLHDADFHAVVEVVVQEREREVWAKLAMVETALAAAEAARDQALADLAKSEAGHLIQSGQHVIDLEKLDAALAERDDAIQNACDVGNRCDDLERDLAAALAERDAVARIVLQQAEYAAELEAARDAALAERDGLLEALDRIADEAAAALATTPSTDD